MGRAVVAILPTTGSPSLAWPRLNCQMAALTARTATLPADRYLRCMGRSLRKELVVICNPLFSLKGWHNKAQGNALGKQTLFSLKGWHNKAQGNALGKQTLFSLKGWHNKAQGNALGKQS